MDEFPVIQIPDDEVLEEEEFGKLIFTLNIYNNKMFDRVLLLALEHAFRSLNM